MRDYIVFREFATEEEAYIVANQLKRNNISSKVEVKQVILDAVIIGDNYRNKYVLKIAEEDFEQGKKILLDELEIEFTNVDKNYMLFKLSNEELVDITNKPDEWGDYNYKLANLILEERKINVFKTEVVLPELIKPEFVYATTGQRLGNYAIDIVAYYAFNFIVFFIMGMIMALSGKDSFEIHDFFSDKLIVYMIAFVNLLVYYFLMEGVTKGRTIGKYLTGTKAVRQDLTTITWKNALMRTLSRIVPFEPFSALGDLPWHDKWTKTMVIKINRK